MIKSISSGFIEAFSIAARAAFTAKETVESVCAILLFTIPVRSTIQSLFVSTSSLRSKLETVFVGTKLPVPIIRLVIIIEILSLKNFDNQSIWRRKVFVNCFLLYRY